MPVGVSHDKWHYHWGRDGKSPLCNNPKLTKLAEVDERNADKAFCTKCKRIKRKERQKDSQKESKQQEGQDRSTKEQWHTMRDNQLRRLGIDPSKIDQ